VIVRVLLLFLALFVPAFALLAIAGEKNLRRDLPSGGPTMKRMPLLDAKDLTGKDGEPPPLRGIVWKLDETLIRSVETDYINFTLELGELARDERGPHFKRLRARYYDRTEPDKDPLLIYVVESPRVEGDPASMTGSASNQILTMPQGVIVSDGEGRPLFRSSDIVLFGLKERTVHAKGAAEAWYPERGVRIRGLGVHAAFPEDGDESGTFEKDVVVTAPWKGGTLTLRTPGPMSAAREGERIRIRMSGGGTVETNEGLHAFTSATVTLTQREPDENDTPDTGSYEPESIELTGPTHYKPADPAAFHGLEFLEAGGASWSEGTFRAAGPVKTVRRGPFDLFGEGVRRVRLEAGKAYGRTKPGKDGKRDFEVLYLEDCVEAFDLAEGAIGHLNAGRVRVMRESLTATGGVKLRSDRMNAEVDKLVVLLGRTKGAFTAHLTRVRTVRISVPEKDGGRRGTVLLTSESADGHVSVEATARSHVVTATGPFVVAFRETGKPEEEPSTLRAPSLRIIDRKDGDGSPSERRLTASGGFALRDPARRVDASGEKLDYEQVTQIGRIEGAAKLHRVDDQGRTQSVSGDDLVFNLTAHTFAAKRRTVVLLNDDKGTWSIACDNADGQWAENRRPVALQLDGNVRAVGPDGEVLEGDRVAYDGIAQTMVVYGTPAKLRRGDDLSISYDRITVVVEDDRVVSCEGAGDGVLDMRNKGAKKAGGVDTARVTRWRAEISGKTLFENNVVVIPNGGDFSGIAAGKEAVITGHAGRLEIDLADDEAGKKKPTGLRATKGVRIEGVTEKGPVKIRANTMSYDANTGRIVLLGDVRIEGAGYGAVGVLQRAEVLLTDDGVKIQRISRLSARKNK